MNLNTRPAKIGGSINSRSEIHGEELVPAMDIPLASIMLTKPELCAFRRDPTVWDRWFNERADGLPEPADLNMKPRCLTEKYPHSSGQITVGLSDIPFPFEDCCITKIRLTPCVGGLTELELTLQVLISEDNTALFEYMAKDCNVQLTFGKLEEKKNPNQPELNLNASAKPEEHPDPRG